MPPAAPQPSVPPMVGVLPSRPSGRGSETTVPPPTLFQLTCAERRRPWRQDDDPALRRPAFTRIRATEPSGMFSRPTKAVIDLR